MTDFVARVKEYKGWTQEKRDEIYQALLAVIQRNVMYGIGALVLLSDYREVINTEFRQAVVGQPFTYCSKMCLFAAAQWAERIGYKDSIRYVFDDGDQHKQDILKAHTPPNVRSLRVTLQWVHPSLP